MKYLSKGFSVGAAGTQEYRDNWERTFRTPRCEAKNDHHQCALPEGHRGLHQVTLDGGDVLSWEPVPRCEWCEKPAAYSVTDKTGFPYKRHSCEEHRARTVQLFKLDRGHDDCDCSSCLPPTY